MILVACSPSKHVRRMCYCEGLAKDTVHWLPRVGTALAMFQSLSYIEIPCWYFAYTCQDTLQSCSIIIITIFAFDDTKGTTTLSKHRSEVTCQQFWLLGGEKVSPYVVV